MDSVFYITGNETLYGGSAIQRCMVSGYPTEVLNVSVCPSVRLSVRHN